MGFPEDAIPLSTTKDDFLTREIVLTHDPDDRWLESDMLLNLVESIFCYTSENVSEAQIDVINVADIDLIGSEEPISLIIYKISNEIISQCFVGENLHQKTLLLLEMLSRHRWDAKVVLVLASFAANFGVFWLILLLQSDNGLAVSLAIVKRLPKAIGMLKPKFKALNLLVITMIKLAKLVIRFEEMSLQHELVDNDAMDIVKSKIYMATYWICRSILVCSSQIADSRNLGLEQVYSDGTVVAAWGLLSLRKKLSSLCYELGEYVDKCREQIGTRLYERLLCMFKDNNQFDNQKVLRTLLASENEFPLKKPSSGEKVSFMHGSQEWPKWNRNGGFSAIVSCGILDLKNKIVILLISKPELLPIDKIFLLVQQTYDAKTERNYDVVWFPIPSTSEWSREDKTSFEFLSNRLPWFSIRRPWSINLSVINYIKQEWSFKELDDPMMVVLNENGMVVNSNAMDMVWIWGLKAFPFSTSREKELWDEANWTLDLMINGTSSLLSQWVEEGKNLCIYGSGNLDWIKEFNSKTKKIKNASGIHLEAVYVGCKNPSEDVKAIIDTIYQENLSTSLTFNKVNLFWFRLETIKRSILGHYQEHTAKIAAEVTELLGSVCNTGWAVIGRGLSADVIKLDQGRLEECVDMFPLWCENVGTMGLVGAIRSALEPPLTNGNCHHDELLPYEEGLMEKTMICSSCKRRIEKFFVYKCEE